MSPSADPFAQFEALNSVGGMAGSCCLMVLQVVFMIGVSWMIASALGVVPEGLRRVPIAAAWIRLLGLAPCIGAPFLLVYDFWLLPMTSRSLAGAARASGAIDRGSCGEGMAWSSCVLTAIAGVLTLGGVAAGVVALGADPRWAELGEVDPESPALGALAVMSIFVFAACIVWLVSLVLFLVWLVKVRGVASALVRATDAA